LRLGGVSHMVEYLPSKCEALGSIPGTAKIINKQIKY
jgi:hypothetical protein